MFDASSKCTNGQSLNQTLFVGPKLQTDVMAVLIRFRIGAVALTADVKQMFRQIRIHPTQQDYQRIVWRFSEDEPVADYRLRTVTFGITPSPYLAIRCLLQLATEGKETYPLASAALKSSLYVDDVVTSVSSVEEARELQGQLQLLLRSGGFELRKWASSHPAVLRDLDPELCSRSLLTFEPSGEQFLKVLGLRWYSQTDSFGFQVNTLERECTKRSILSDLARIFDPLGFLAPLTFAAKRMVQQLWTLKLGWDDRPPQEICTQWAKYKAELSSLTFIRISRSIALNNTTKQELHGFCDASEQGYGAVVYLRVVTSTDTRIHLLGAKSRVAPLKPITLPRLELCAAVLLSDLMSYIRNSLQDEICIDAMYAWSDSTVALSWIRSTPSRWKTFLRNRIAHIQTKIETQCWRHVNSECNPADCCSRGLFPQGLVKHSLWWTGPSWLPNFNPVPDMLVELEEYPAGEERSSVAFTSVVSARAVLPPVDAPVLNSLLHRFSSLDVIVRIMAYCLRFVNSCRLKPPPRSVTVDSVEFHSALLALIRPVQNYYFAEDIDRLNRKLLCSSALRRLVPFLDSQGVLRVGGRLSRSDIFYEAKHPALLPGKHRLTELIIEYTHKKHLHPGRRALHYLLARNFWILGAHRAIKCCLSNCHQCFRANPRILQPPMADLPEDRVRQAKPFSITGVDYAGPFLVHNRRSRGAIPFKVYVCMFVCFIVKAVHLELAFSLSAESFLSALRRFIARRGRCSQLYSDCGTNFVGAHRELIQYMRTASDREKISWSFNPPSAPHFGGLWETGVKSMKTHLRRVVGDQILTVEEFGTILAQIEAVLNSRPLCPVSSDPNDLEVLSPGHFLTLEPLVSVPYHNLELVPMGRLDRWQLVQRMHQSFWKRWHDEYLHGLQQRSKWLKPNQPVLIDTLVLLKNELVPPLQWRRGRIVELHPGQDGVPRVATVRTSDGLLKRPLVRLCPLPMGQSFD